MNSFESWELPLPFSNHLMMEHELSWYILPRDNSESILKLIKILFSDFKIKLNMIISLEMWF